MRARRSRGEGPAVIHSLLRPTARVLPRAPLTAGVALGLLVAALPRLLPDAESQLLGLALLRATALAFALGLTFLLDEPARPTTEAVPTGRQVRTWLRAALALPAAALGWCAALLLIPQAARPPLADVTAEAAALTATALALAAAAARRSSETRPGRIAVQVLPVLVVAGILLPERWGLFVAPGSPEWDAAHDRWAAVLLVALTLWTASVREPIRRRALRNGFGRGMLRP
ncbi:ABC transporter [Streptomyces sp. MUM 2J]|uniref:ABC transporter n=1 Tax=Streptomyces sp. MUM 2J TaxID=2791987 RepID=UPI001F03A05F|nr:ABC transporter [Streptomyces sp. MUM 2J]MCH0566111.1 ABC transporter [Streptomyces sp. MUM 2J]